MLQGKSRSGLIWMCHHYLDLKILSRRNFVKVKGVSPNCLATWRALLEQRNLPLPRPEGFSPGRGGSYNSWEVEGAEDREQLNTKKNFLITVPTQNELGCHRRAWVLHPRRHSDRGEMPTKQKYHRMVSGVRGWGGGEVLCAHLPSPGSLSCNSECTTNDISTSRKA